MSKNSDASEKANWWTNFGKVMAAIIACIVGIVTISINLFPSGPDLVGHGWHTDFAVPPNLEAAHDSLKNRTDPHYLYDFIKERVSTTSQDSLPNILFELSDSIRAGFGEDFVYSFQKYRSFVFITIRNEGDRVASDVVLDFPVEGIARITHPDTAQYVTQVDRNVSLNKLRPGNNVQVEIWTGSHIWGNFEEGFRITYANGVGSIAFSKRFSGYRRFIADYIGSILHVVIFLVVFCLLFLLVWRLLERLSKTYKE